MIKDQWTNEDIKILHEMAPQGVGAVQDALQDRGRARTLTSIYNKARRLGISLPRLRTPRRRTKWSQPEECILAANAHLGVAAVMRALLAAGYHRSDSQIRYYAEAVGVAVVKAGTRRWTRAEIGIMRGAAVRGADAAHNALLEAGYRDRSRTMVRNKMTSLKLLDRICPHCGQIYRIHHGTRRCGHCGRTNFPKPAPGASGGRSPGACSKVQQHHARIEHPMPDPWTSGEISQRPHFRTPDPMYGF
jgi:ribosomal protein S27AE